MFFCLFCSWFKLTQNQKKYYLVVFVYCMAHTDPKNNNCNKLKTFLNNKIMLTPIRLDLFNILFKTLLHQIDLKIDLIH